MRKLPAIKSIFTRIMIKAVGFGGVVDGGDDGVVLPASVPSVSMVIIVLELSARIMFGAKIIMVAKKVTTQIA